MLTDIVSALSLNCNSTDQKLIVATKDVKSDLNFIFSEILSYYIKNDFSVILVNLAQSSNHYNHLFLKSGINMRQLRDQQKFFIVDVLSDIEKVSVCSDPHDNAFGTLFSDPLSPDCLKELYLSVKKSVDLLKSSDESRRYVILIDEISVLINLGVNLNSIEPFVQYCLSLVSNSPLTPHILFMGAVQELNDVQNAKLLNFLLHLSDVRIQIEGLKTGYSKDAQGKITFYVVNKETCKSHHQKMLFKVTEKGAKLLTLGL